MLTIVSLSSSVKVTTKRISTNIWYMAAMHPKELLWFSLEPDGECIQIALKKLTELCIQELIDDIFLITPYLPKLPDHIHASILSSAVAQNKIVTIEYLLRWCPYERINLPTPKILKSFHTIAERDERRTKIANVYENYIELVTTVLSVFFDLIQRNSTESKLCYLDLGTVPIGEVIFDIIKSFLLRMPVISRQCTLSCTVLLTKSTDIFLLTHCLEQANTLGLKLVITGIFFYNNYYPDVTVIRLLEYLRKQDVELITFNFSTLLPSVETVCGALCNFKLVKYLNMSYLKDALSSGSHLRSFASTLTEFPFLERLVLKGHTLTGQLSNLFQEFCKKNAKLDFDSKCCIIHNGTLKYLDISGCKLTGKDLEVLKEFALKNSLKYLNISDNALGVNSTWETLLSLKSSLILLKMDHCFLGQVQYDPEVFPISEFKKLRYLSMKGLDMTQNNKLSSELLKMPNLPIIVT